MVNEEEPFRWGDETLPCIKEPTEFTDESFDAMLRGLLLVLCAGSVVGSVTSAEGPGGCPSGPLDQVLEKLAAGGSIQVADGVKFVKVSGGGEGGEGRSAGDTILSRVQRFFANYELQLRFSDIFQRKQDMTDALRRAFTSLNEIQEGNEETSRGKGGGGFGGGKKGGGAILVMATMMGGMMAALGYGALGMLVMKALTVSSMALLLSAVMGLRRLLRRPDDDAGFGRISYIPVHTEHRKRRSFQDVPYRAYAKHK